MKIESEYVWFLMKNWLIVKWNWIENKQGNKSVQQKKYEMLWYFNEEKEK
jgi:hypothetical protein